MRVSRMSARGANQQRHPSFSRQHNRTKTDLGRARRRLRENASKRRAALLCRPAVHQFGFSQQIVWIDTGCAADGDELRHQ